MRTAHAYSARTGPPVPATHVLLALAAGAILPAAAHGDAFVDVGAALAVVDGPSLAWGDYDSDGDLDILLAGRDTAAPGRYIARIYRSSGGSNPTFAEAVQLPGVYESDVAWGDYDNDGFLDVLSTGTSLEGCGIVWLHHSNGGSDPTFSWVDAGLPSLYEGSVSWGDFDNDGDLDALVTGTRGYNPETHLSAVYRNEGGATPAFTDIGAGLPGAKQGSGNWADYDEDGDLDILLTGTLGEPNQYRNDGGATPTFSPVFLGLTDLSQGSTAEFGDYEGDGDLDILMTGDAGSGDPAVVYRRVNGFYSGVASVDGGRHGAGAWGDYDNDGDLDFAAVGYNIFAGSLSRVYRNEGGPFPQFHDIVAGLPAVGEYGSGAFAWGDYDNDGDLDLLLAGAGPSLTITRVYRNDAPVANTPPTAPTNLAANVVGTHATFSWDPATDAQTPAAGLSYNLRVGTSPGAGDILSPMADGTTGFRRIPALGNTNQSTSRELELPAAGAYYWSVQAIDGAFAGSPFAPEANTGATAAPVVHESPAATLRGAPNPFSSGTSIRFGQPARGPVTLRIYDVAGRRVRTLEDGELPAGQYTRTWDGRNDSGVPLPSGTYFARLRTSAAVTSEKVTLLR
jgi:FlgD Ig-like domain/FG-GAP-like repeat